MTESRLCETGKGQETDDLWPYGSVNFRVLFLW
jgi:hypothetical protein